MAFFGGLSGLVILIVLDYAGNYKYPSFKEFLTLFCIELLIVSGFFDLMDVHSVLLMFFVWAILIWQSIVFLRKRRK
jgi:hypothetical protein